jgi:pimeloyl-ACP methyl ester carboxylesterase
MIPPLDGCLFDWMHITWDDTSQSAAENGYVHAWTGPVGDLESIRHLDTLGDTHLIGTYEILIDNYENAGWKSYENIFGLPYDWRFGLTLPQSYWNNVTSFIESTVQTTGEKAVLVGHSMGGFYIHNFLSRVTTPEWRAKYIDSAILIAPSVGGAGPAFGALWTRTFPFGGFLGSFDALEWIGGLDIHMPNLEIYADTVIYKGPNGETRTGKEVRDLLFEKGKISGGSAKLFDSQVPFFSKAPATLDVPVSIVYNSKLSTTIGIDQTSGTDEYFYGEGDNYVNKEAIEWICANWKGPTVVDCWDLLSDDFWTANHGTLLGNPDVLKWVVNRTVDPTWQERI